MYYIGSDVIVYRDFAFISNLLIS